MYASTVSSAGRRPSPPDREPASQTFDLTAIDPNTPAGVARLGAAVEALGGGALAAFPTDTVWGIGTCSLDPARVAELFALKGRPAEKPLSYLIPSALALETIFEDEVPPGLEAAAARYWPGATTLVVPAPAHVLPQARRGAPGVGLRVPGHAMLRRVLTGLPPMANTSANRSGDPPLADAAAVRAAFGDRLDVLLLMDPPTRRVASQVLSLRPDGAVEVLRAAPAADPPRDPGGER